MFKRCGRCGRCGRNIAGKQAKAVKPVGLNADTPATADTLRAGRRVGGHV